MNLTMISPDALREFTIEWLQLITNEGWRTILPGHVPFIALLISQQTISMKLPGGAIKSVTIQRGIVSVERTSVTIVLEES